MRRPRGRRQLASPIAAVLVALVVISLGLVLAAVAAYSHMLGASFPVALALLDRSYVPHLWAETGVAGALAGAAGAVVAGLSVVVRRRPDSSA